MSMTFRQRRSDLSEGREKPFETAVAVAEFHRAFNLPMRPFPSSETEDDLAKLRVTLLEEEVGEFVTASEKRDLIGIADALADIVYVVYGTALTYGIDLELGPARSAPIEHEQAYWRRKAPDQGGRQGSQIGTILSSRHRFSPRPARPLSQLPSANVPQLDYSISM